MKKSLLILSMAAMAVNAVAFDQPVAGTADAPNYYVIKANRGVPYLAYSAEGVDAPNGKTNLTRTNDLTTANVWAVTAGTAEGSLVIKNYTADAYLMDFFNASGSTVASGASANTVSTPTDIFAIELDGAYALNINSADGSGVDGNYLTLDAPGGTVAYCGNWIPRAPSTGEGTSWWFTKVTPAPGQSMEDAVVAAMMQPAVDAAVDELGKYMASAPMVATELQAGVDQLKAMAPVVDFAAKIDEIKNAAISAANTALVAALNGKVYALKSPRRVTTATQGAYLAVNGEKTGYTGAVTYATENAAFTFASKDNGYTVYNAATQTYIGTAATPVADASAAQLIYPVLYNHGEFFGVALCNDAARNANGINWQSWNDGNVSFWSIADGGSIWALEVIDAEKAVADAIAKVKNALSPYIPNVYPAKDILEKAIADSEALTFSPELDAKADEIITKAYADVNNLLATGLDNKVVLLKYLRGNDFVEVVEGRCVHNAAPTANGRFVFNMAGEGAYTLYNSAAKLYLGPGEQVENQVVMTMVENAQESQPVYPVLHHFGDFYGVALPFSAEKTGNGLNMNGDPDLKSYTINDGGSIWGLVDPATSLQIETVEAAAPVREGIYDLSGRRLNAPVRGINIINGKKVLVK